LQQHINPTVFIVLSPLRSLHLERIMSFGRIMYFVHDLLMSFYHHRFTIIITTIAR
jgi:hypothetical protein